MDWARVWSCEYCGEIHDEERAAKGCCAGGVFEGEMIDGTTFYHDEEWEVFALTHEAVEDCLAERVEAYDMVFCHDCCEQWDPDDRPDCECDDYSSEDPPPVPQRRPAVDVKAPPPNFEEICGIMVPARVKVKAVAATKEEPSLPASVGSTDLERLLG